MATRIVWTTQERQIVAASIGSLIVQNDLYPVTLGKIKHYMKPEYFGQNGLMQNRVRKYFSGPELATMLVDVKEWVALNKVKKVETKVVKAPLKTGRIVLLSTSSAIVAVPLFGAIPVNELVRHYKPDVVPETYIFSRVVKLGPVSLTVQELMTRTQVAEAQLKVTRDQISKLEEQAHDTKPFQKCWNEWTKEFPGTDVFAAAMKWMEHETAPSPVAKPQLHVELTVSHDTKVTVTKQKPPVVLDVVVAGIHEKNRDILKREFPYVNIIWLEPRQSDAVVKNAASGRHCIACTHGTNPKVQTMMKNLGKSYALPHGVTGVARAIQNRLNILLA